MYIVRKLKLVLTDQPSLSTVFDILLTFCTTGSWIKALQAWFPRSKGYVVSSAVCAPLPEADAKGGSLE